MDGLIREMTLEGIIGAHGWHHQSVFEFHYSDLTRAYQ
jgi:hypothetical protein